MSRWLEAFLTTFPTLLPPWLTLVGLAMTSITPVSLCIGPSTYPLTMPIALFGILWTVVGSTLMVYAIARR